MALKDFEAFIRERVLLWDPNQDVSAGSPFDTTVIQPLLGRIGTDPFSTNLPLFIRERLAQEFPEQARGDGGALPDLLMKPAEILMDPLVREINRIALSQSVADPSLLTVDEAEAIMANLFSERKKGTLSRGVGRLYFSSPRSVEVNPADYCLSKRGYVFNPVSIQSIRQDEMLFNTEGSLYYFDVNLEAEAAGDQYNVDPDELVSIANLTGVVRVTNKRRFRSGTPAENAVEYVSRAEQELSEKSLVALRGIMSIINRNFPEITRLAVVGHGDPEMDRDVLKGGGYGPIIEVGTSARGWSDGNSGTHTRRIRMEDPGVDFQLLIGMVGPSSGFALTLEGAFDAGEDLIQDIAITRVVDSTTLELESNKILGSAQSIAWALRKKSITIGDIPGGILFPDGPNGTVEVLENEVHVGGCTDLYVRSSGFTQSTLTIEAVADDEPAMQGSLAYYDSIVAGAFPVVLKDVEFYNSALGNDATSDYFLRDGDPTYELLANMASNGYVFRVLAPSHNAGTYRVLRVIQDPDGPSDRYPVLLLERAMTAPIGVGNPLTWRIQDDIDVDLTDPRETKWEGSDLRTYAGLPYIDTAGGVDFDSLGVVAGDTVRILNGGDMGEYTLAANPLGPGYTKIQLTQNLTRSAGNISFKVYRANQPGGIELPLVRITQVDLLDSSSQPVGSQIPYGRPVYCKSNAFSNAGHGIKLEVRDACVGIVGTVLGNGPSGQPEASAGGSSISVRWYVYWNLTEVQYKKSKTINFSSVSLPSPRMTLQEIVDQINAALIAEIGAQVSAAHIIDDRRLGIAPIGAYTEVWDSDYSNADSAYKKLFGTFTADASGTAGYKRWQPPMTSRDVRSDTVSNIYLDPNADDEWFDDKYDIDRSVDGVDLVDGLQPGHYGIMPTWHPLQPIQTLAGYEHIRDHMDVKIQLLQDMNPEADIHIRVGARSIGTARLYFLEPVTIEFGQQSTFTVNDDGVERVYFPDPSVHTSRIPGHPNTEELKDGELTIVPGTPTSNTDYGYIASNSANFYETGVRVGDLVSIKYEELYGDVDLDLQVLSLDGKQLVLSIDNSADISVEFAYTGTGGGGPYVDRDKIAEQINEQLGMEIAKISNTQGGALQVLTFSADVSVVVRYKSGATYANDILGLAVSRDESNMARCEGTYVVQNIESSTKLVCRRIEGTISWSNTDTLHLLVPQHLSILRAGTQRYSSTLMNSNAGPAGLYYVDIELSSKGVGDDFNIAAGLEMRVDQFLSYGYQLSAVNQELTFSMLEQPYLHLPPVFFPVGTSDEVQNAITVVGQNLQVTYDTTSIIDSVQDFVNNELDRVTCANILVRHLLPYFVKLDISYYGGSKASLVQEDLENFIEGLFPNQGLQADAIISKIKNRGATAISNPIDVIAVVHSEDRDIWLDWSQNSINAGRLAAFFADDIRLTRQSS